MAGEVAQQAVRGDGPAVVRAGDGRGGGVEEALLGQGVGVVEQEVQRHRQFGGVVLGVDVTACPVVHDLAGRERGVFEEGQVDGFAGVAVDGCGVVLPDGGGVSGAEVSDGQEREVVVVRGFVGVQGLFLVGGQ
ncbi:hypothetical protein [Streptomyces sp. BE133]|uniref:hypothetical protein n=1 Tax=Streptomyces sp. BE133 TaxID=3002523 RepID=UPI003FA7D22E